MDQLISLDQLVIDETLQPRLRGIDPGHVKSLMETPDRWPPVMVASLDGVLYLVDGFHRVAAAKALGLTEIRAVVLQALVVDDLRTMAYGSNAHHGRALTLADRKAYVEALAEEPEYDDTAMASIGYLSLATVRRLHRRVARRVAGVGHDNSRPRVATRPLGELPEQGLGSRVLEVAMGILGSKDRKRHRRVAGYLQRLAVSLEEGERIREWQTPGDAAEALRSELEPDELTGLTGILGRTAADVLAVAQLLGYAPEAD